MEVIYADVLFCVNFYVSYVLLILTRKVMKFECGRIRIFFSCIFSALYSFIILIPNISEKIISISRIFALTIIILIAFPLKNKRQFFTLSLCFLAVNFAFAGLMFCLWYFFAPAGMYYNSGIVYFNISLLELVILTAVSYVVLSLIQKIVSLKAPKDMIYDMSIEVFGKAFSLRGFYDSGCNLKDPFTGLPVIIVNENIFKYEAFSNICSIDSINNIDKIDFPFHCIVSKSLGGEKVLPCFTAENAVFKSLENNFEIKKIAVAITDVKIKGGDFDAIISKDILNYN